MLLIKIKKQMFNKLKDSRQSDLYETINKFLPHLSEEDKGIVAGLCIEYVIASDGDPEIFEMDRTLEGDEEWV